MCPFVMGYDFIRRKSTGGGYYNILVPVPVSLKVPADTSAARRRSYTISNFLIFFSRRV